MKTIVIAEVGENHYGRWDVCRGMVEEIARHGATYAKFQTYTADNFGKDHEWYDWFKGVAMPEAEHFEMQKLCAEKNVGFLSSTFTIGTTRFLVEKMKCTSLKVASSRLVDYDLLDDINNRADKVKTVYLSSGMGTLDEIRTAIEHLSKIENLYLLHCTSQYPCEDENVNLRAMVSMQEAFPDYPVGYSCHNHGVEACLAAVALGATVIEKHFTYHVDMPGDDHKGGMTPEMLGQMVQSIARIETILGSAEKAPVAAEKRAVENLRVPMLDVGFE